MLARDIVLAQLRIDMRSAIPPVMLRRKRMQFTTLPLNTPVEYAGVALRTILYPEIHGHPRELESLFDIWCNAIGEGSDPASEFRLAGYGAVAKTMRGFTLGNVHANTFLLMMLSRAEGVTVERGDNTLLITADDVTFGIKDGIVVSRFSSGMPMSIDIKNIDTRQRKVVTFDQSFIALYRHAYLRGSKCGNAIQAITALKMGSPDLSLATLFEKSKIVAPGDAEIDAIEKCVVKAKDPMLALFNSLVPKWINRTEFRKHIGQLRARHHDDESRNRYLQKFHMFFHNKKKELK